MKWTAALAAATALALASTADAKPNLKVAAVGKLPAAAREGTAFELAVETTANTGGSRAPATTTRYYLTRDGLPEILLDGVRQVPGLAAGERSPTPRGRPTRLRVPYGTPRGAYELLACADDRDVARESNERDNCRTGDDLAIRGLPGALRMDSFTDFLVEETDQEAEQKLVPYTRSLCAAPAGPKSALGLKKALANIEEHLARTAGASDVRAFERSRDHRSAKRLEAAAAAALLRKLPGAGLAALIRAHELEPKEASHLVGAASLATAVGLPREALGLLDAAERLDDRVPGAWGLNRDAVALANRGHALSALGRYAEAEAALVAARQLEPALKEASRTASVAALCQGRVAAAVRHRKQGRDREAAPVHPEEDDSFGKETGLRKLPLPPTAGANPAMVDFYAQEVAAMRSKELPAQQAEERDLKQAWESRALDPLTWKQGYRLIMAVYRVSAHPKVKALQDEYFAQVDQVWDVQWGFWCGGNTAACGRTGAYARFQEESREACRSSTEYGRCYESQLQSRCRPALRSAHQQWLTEIQQAWEAADRHQRALSKRISALAPHAKDPDLHRFLMLQIRVAEYGTYLYVRGPAAVWADWARLHERYCIETHEAVSEVAPGPVAGQSNGPCPPALKAMNAVIDLGVAALKLNCEEIQLEGETPGWISGFGEVAFNPRAGTISVFAGARAGAGVPGLKGEFKSGLYLTVSNSGLEDAGWRVGSSLTVGAGPVEFAPKDEVDMSFVGLFTPYGG